MWPACPVKLNYNTKAVKIKKLQQIGGAGVLIVFIGGLKTFFSILQGFSNMARGDPLLFFQVSYCPAQL